MPPLPFWVQGKQAVSELLSREILAGEGRGRFKLVPLHANGQSGFAFYRVNEAARTFHPFALQVITIKGGLISDVTTFGMPALFRHFHLPSVLP